MTEDTYFVRSWSHPIQYNTIQYKENNNMSPLLLKQISTGMLLVWFKLWRPYMQNQRVDALYVCTKSYIQHYYSTTVYYNTVLV